MPAKIKKKTTKAKQSSSDASKSRIKAIFTIFFGIFAVVLISVSLYVKYSQKSADASSGSFWRSDSQCYRAGGQCAGSGGYGVPPAPNTINCNSYYRGTVKNNSLSCTVNYLNTKYLGYCCVKAPTPTPLPPSCGSQSGFCANPLTCEYAGGYQINASGCGGGTICCKRPTYTAPRTNSRGVRYF